MACNCLIDCNCNSCLEKHRQALEANRRADEHIYSGKKTMEVSLQEIADFASENGYRINMQGPGPDRHSVDCLLEDQPDFICRCKIVGCGIDFRHTISLDGVYEFDLIS